MISIIMATYNSSSFMDEQIQSLLNQTVPFEKLYIQDDYSSDDTLLILEKYRRQQPDRIFISQLEKNSGNPKHNFYSLMSRIQDQYIMLCDQDDVWLPDKIEKTLAKIKELEKVYGVATPLLVHTDLMVVDKNLCPINNSFRIAMNADYNRTQLKDQIIQNTLTGCTAMYNYALSQLIRKKEPSYMVMHDWWLMLIASAFGHIDHINDQTILYRQHGSNEVGAKDVRTLRYKIKKLVNNQDVKNAINVTYKQAESFLGYYKTDLTQDQITLLTSYCKIQNMQKLQKWAVICKLGTFKCGFSRNIAYFLFV